MKMVIELEDDLYKRILDMKQPLFMNDLDSVYKAIVNGTSLPEHHGRLIDADKLIRDTLNNPLHAPYIYKADIKYATTIIEAEVKADEDSN